MEMTACPHILPATRPLPHQHHALFPAWIADKKREAIAISPDGDTPQDLDHLAINAARLSAEATAELLRFAREGAAHTAWCFEPDTIEKLAEALHAMVGIELAHIDLKADPAGAELLGQIWHACMNFLEGWA
jgi:hypothetical protein